MHILKKAGRCKQYEAEVVSKGGQGFDELNANRLQAKIMPRDNIKDDLESRTVRMVSDRRELERLGAAKGRRDETSCNQSRGRPLVSAAPLFRARGKKADRGLM